MLSAYSLLTQKYQILNVLYKQATTTNNRISCDAFVISNGSEFFPQNVFEYFLDSLKWDMWTTILKL